MKVQSFLQLFERSLGNKLQAGSVALGDLQVGDYFVDSRGRWTLDSINGDEFTWISKRNTAFTFNGSPETMLFQAMEQVETPGDLKRPKQRAWKSRLKAV